MWQSRIEIEYYFIVYFEHITSLMHYKRCASAKHYSMLNLVMRLKYVTE